ncbi:hypothetical protein RFI_39334 [Reticulomyxa filosa]|uniref:Uncharacterized protein n=1 Tax=Reticulomyxa filosa TaxID=46433 RepID=X6L9Y5_RETFI|nr:hypothetical protein RFI_39334 [Reticulomyxa filosa]|eukprot:ETN98180.1 hypothetical protein RFI_39334 [Reticulomyxa filosa]
MEYCLNLSKTNNINNNDALIFMVWPWRYKQWRRHTILENKISKFITQVLCFPKYLSSEQDPFSFLTDFPCFDFDSILLGGVILKYYKFSIFFSSIIKVTYNSIFSNIKKVIIIFLIENIQNIYKKCIL